MTFANSTLQSVLPEDLQEQNFNLSLLLAKETNYAKQLEEVIEQEDNELQIIKTPIIQEIDTQGVEKSIIQQCEVQIQKKDRIIELMTKKIEELERENTTLFDKYEHEELQFRMQEPEVEYISLEQYEQEELLLEQYKEQNTELRNEAEKIVRQIEANQQASKDFDTSLVISRLNGENKRLREQLLVLQQGFSSLELQNELSKEQLYDTENSQLKERILQLLQQENIEEEKYQEQLQEAKLDGELGFQQLIKQNNAENSLLLQQTQKESSEELGRYREQLQEEEEKLKQLQEQYDKDREVFDEQSSESRQLELKLAEIERVTETKVANAKMRYEQARMQCEHAQTQADDAKQLNELNMQTIQKLQIELADTKQRLAYLEKKGEQLRLGGHSQCNSEISRIISNIQEEALGEAQRIIREVEEKSSVGTEKYLEINGSREAGEKGGSTPKRDSQSQHGSTPSSDSAGAPAASQQGEAASPREPSQNSAE